MAVVAVTSAQPAWALDDDDEPLQLASGNKMQSDSSSSGESDGTLRDQLLLYADLSAGAWLYRNQCSRHRACLTDIAAAVGFHYTTALEDANTLEGFSSASGTSFSLGNVINRFDVVNVNAGLYWTLYEYVTVYTGFVAPLTDGTDRFFDAEPMCSVNFQL